LAVLGIRKPFFRSLLGLVAAIVKAEIKAACEMNVRSACIVCPSAEFFPDGPAVGYYTAE
jgi:hypothetical protein